MMDFPIVWVAIAVVIGIFVVRRIKRRPRIIGTTRADAGIDVEGDLLAACRGDRALAERLIAHELKNNDTLSRTGAALMALTKLRDDQR